MDFIKKEIMPLVLFVICFSAFVLFVAPEYLKWRNHVERNMLNISTVDIVLADERIPLIRRCDAAFTLIVPAWVEGYEGFGRQETSSRYSEVCKDFR